MTLHIKCPSCDRQFKVSEDLRGRTVECGACEHRFKLGEEVVVGRRDKFYPGEHHNAKLEGFGRTPPATNAPVRFETAAYNQTSSVLDVTPMSPQEWLSTMFGAGVLVIGMLLLFFGAQPRGILLDVELPQRTVLAVFIVVIGSALIAYGCRHRKKIGLTAGFPLVVGVLALALFMPVPRTIVPVRDESELPSPNPPEERTPDVRRKTAEEVRNMIGYGPVERAIKAHEADSANPEQFVVAIWVPVIEERYKLPLLKYLQRVTRSVARPGFYRREEGGIFVLDGLELSMDEVATFAERFGRVEDIYTEIRTIELTLERELIGEVSPDLMSKLTDTTHPAFYARNQLELDHIDLDRVKGAVRRLGEVEPLRFRVEIARRLMGLLEEETDPELRGDVCKALLVWAEDGDESNAVVARVAQEMQAAGQTLHRSMMDFLVKRQAPEAVAIIEPLWVGDPISWEPIVIEIGPAAEDAVVRHVTAAERQVQQSAIRVLKRIGTARSIPVLREAQKAADDETKLLFEEAIGNIETNS